MFEELAGAAVPNDPSGSEHLVRQRVGEVAGRYGVVDRTVAGHV